MAKHPNPGKYQNCDDDNAFILVRPIKIPHVFCVYYNIKWLYYILHCSETTEMGPAIRPVNVVIKEVCQKDPAPPGEYTLFHNLKTVY